MQTRQGHEREDDIIDVENKKCSILSDKTNPFAFMGTKAIKRQTRLHFTTSDVCSPFFSSCLLNRSFLQTRRTRRIASSYKTQDRFHSILHFFRLNAIAYITLVLCTLSLQKKNVSNVLYPMMTTSCESAIIFLLTLFLSFFDCLFFSFFMLST